jgi:hypothetical protein
VRVEKENALADLALFGPAGPTSVRELNTLRRQWEQSRKQLAQQTAERLAQAKDSYLAELDALRQQMVAQNRAEVVLAVKREQEDVRRDRETPGESAATLPIELRTIKLPHQQAGQQIRREQAERCHRMLESYRENLEFLAASLAARGATEAAALVRVEKICVRISGAAENQALRKTDRAGGDGGSEFYDVNSDGGLLVGVRVYHSESNGRQIVKGIQPVYLTPRGKVAGNAHGARSGTPLSLEAKDGYAVGALNLHSAQKVDGLEVVFMKINSSGSGLVAGDSYKSAWCGATGNAGLKHLGGDGKLVAGLHGSSGRELMAIGLVQVP